MLELPLFRIFEEVEVNETDELVAMVNALFDQKKYEDLDWWEKLTGVWEEDHAYNVELKKAILRRFYAGEMEFPEVHFAGCDPKSTSRPGPAAGPEVGIRPNGYVTCREPQVKPEADEPRLRYEADGAGGGNRSRVGLGMMAKLRQTAGSEVMGGAEPGPAPYSIF